MSNLQNRLNKPQNKYIRFTTIALQMGLTIYLGSKLGEWLDIKFNNNKQLYFKITTLVAVGIAIYSVIKQLLNITKDND